MVDLSFTYDENGNITNYDTEMQKLTDKYKSMEAKYAKDGGISDAE